MGMRAWPAAAIAMVAGFLGAASGETGRWTSPDEVSAPDRQASSPEIAIGPGGILHVIWEEAWSENSFGSTRIVHAEHDGARWLAPEFISPPWPASSSPSVAVDSLGRPHVAWLDRGASASRCVVRYSFRDEGVWSTPRSLSATERVGREGRPRIVMLDPDNPAVIWSDDDSRGNAEVFWNHVASGSWLGEQPLSTIDQYHSEHADATLLPGGKLAVVWVDRRPEGLQPLVRTFDGTSWGPIESGGPATWDMQRPALAAAGDFLLLFYATTSGIEVRSSYLQPYWDDPVLLPTSVASPSFDVVAADPYSVVLAYEDRTADESVLLARTYWAEWSVFDGVPSQVAHVAGAPPGICVAADAALEPHVAWCDPVGSSPAGAILHSVLPLAALPRFARGDVDGTGLALSDAVAVLFHLFDGVPIPCLAAADANADGAVALGDALCILQHLFTDGPPPPPPYPECGDAERSALDCAQPGC